MKRIKIMRDENPESPRDWSNLGTMVCWHTRYLLGDEQPKMTPKQYIKELLIKHGTREEKRRAWIKFRQLKKYIKNYKDDFTIDEMVESDLQEEFEIDIDINDISGIIALPLYLYDHSGITMNTKGFSCPWDSGQVGFIYLVVEEAKKEIIIKEDESEEDIHKRLKKCLESEVEIYNYFLTGAVYGYIIEEKCENCNEWHNIDSCWGFYGSHEKNGLFDCAHEAIDVSDEEFEDMKKNVIEKF